MSGREERVYYKIGYSLPFVKDRRINDKYPNLIFLHYKQ